MSKRRKAIAIEEITRDQAERVIGEYAHVDAKIQELTAEMDQKMTKIRDQYADKLDPLKETREEKFKVLQFFAEKNKSLFDKKRSIDLTHGVLGFRRGTPKLKTRKGITWAAVVELAKEFAPDWVRTKEEPAKDVMLAMREEPEAIERMNKIGVLVDADESFFVELKKEEVVV